MALPSGTRLGPYEILSALGAGGMGEVYRAKDTRLDRAVAIKVLPAQLSSDPDRRARFEREARAVSSLNHPHICTLHDIGRQDGIDYLVMEYVEGETLAARLTRGPLPIEQVLRLGAQIADALDKAHRQGIVHRDLKPGNVMLTKSGVKLLDFGLAKLVEEPVEETDTSSPTKSRYLTSEGTLVGTLPYMAPEQVEGKRTDPRGDIWAVGAILYEMVTGRRAFSGKSQASLIAGILDKEPEPIASVLPLVPPAFERAVRRCLTKDPEDRWQSAADLADELRWVAGVESTPARLAASRVAFLPWIVAGTAMVVAIVASIVVWRRGTQPATTASAIPVRFAIHAPPQMELAVSLSLSPDGRQLAFVAEGESGILLFVRALDSLDVRRLSETGNPSAPFWSPDGRSIAFFDELVNKLKRIDVAGGPPKTVCEVTGASGGGTWNATGEIVFAASGAGGLQRVSAEGGTPAPVTTLDAAREETAHLWPAFLPDGRRFLFLARSRRAENTGVFVGSLDGTAPRRLLSVDSSAVYVPPGYLLFGHADTLLAQPFDVERLTVEGTPLKVAEGIRIDQSGRALMSASATGVLAFRSGGRIRTELTWYDRSGKRLGTVGPPGLYAEPALSPDGTRLAVARMDPALDTHDVWIIDLARGTSSRVTTDRADDSVPLWSPDGQTLLYGSDRRGVMDLYTKRLGEEGDELLLHTPVPKVPVDWSRDGRYVVFESRSAAKPGRGRKGSADLWLLPVAGDRTPVALVASEFEEGAGRISPDGRWLAYLSDESGQQQVYVRPFPAGAGRWAISTEGSDDPTWRGDGREMYYLTARSLMAVDVQPGARFAVGPPRRLFDVRVAGWTAVRNYYVPAPDGQRFLFSALPEALNEAPIVVTVNWTAGLPR